VNFRDMDGLDGYGFDSIQSLQIVSWSRWIEELASQLAQPS
jgi:hypothetical protein